MKAVKWEERFFGRWQRPLPAGPDFEHDLTQVLTGWKVRHCEAIRVTYDNGQLCTFKRKARSTKDNE